MRAMTGSPPSDETLFLRLDLLRFPLIVGVVFIHAYETSVGFAGGAIGSSQGSPVGDFIRNLISQGLARVAVPLFFLISGFLFFRHFSATLPAYGAKLRTRLHTLLIPYLFWNLATLAVVALAQALPASAGFFSGKSLPIASYGPGDYVDALFGIGRMPIAYQFWFIRDLMLLVLAAPLVFLGARFQPRLGILLLALGWVLPFWPLSMPAADAALFFFLGAAVALQGWSLFVLDNHARWLLPAYLALALADAALAQQGVGVYLHSASIVVGMGAALCLSGPLARSGRLRQWLLYLSGASFFVYAAHEPVLTIARKLAYKALQPTSTPAVMLLYFAIPLGVIGVLVLVQALLRRTLPGLARVINGGRA